MKRVLPIFIIIYTVLFPASASAQERPLHFISQRHDFGTIAEDGGVVCHSFLFKNSSSKPIVVLDVSGGCSCTKANFTRQPILPSKDGEIRICFDPMNQPEGNFFRKIVITTSESRQTISITGNITPRKKSIAEQYPLALSDELCAEINYHSFGYVEHGKTMRSSFGLINTTDSTVSLHLVPGVESGHLTLNYPKQIAAHQSAVIDFGYTLAEGCNRYGTLQDVLYVDINGTRSAYPLVINGIAIDSRKNNTDKEWQKIQLSENFIKFGTVKQSNTTVTRTITVRNIGLEPLIIRHIECDNSCFTAKINGKTIVDSDQSTTIEIQFSPSAAEFGATVGHIMIITNDPQQPSKRLKVTAIVEK